MGLYNIKEWTDMEFANSQRLAKDRESGKS